VAKNKFNDSVVNERERKLKQKRCLSSPGQCNPGIMSCGIEATIVQKNNILFTSAQKWKVRIYRMHERNFHVFRTLFAI